MEPKFQNSFIPKRPVVSGQGSSIPTRRKQASFFGVIVTLVFLIMLAAVGGVFGYTKYLESDISVKKDALNVAVGDVNLEEIHALLVADTQLKSAASLLQGHLMPTRFFEHLEDLTLHSIQFTDFSYTAYPGKNAHIQMSGTSNSYSSLALQSDVFAQDDQVVSALFSSFDLSDTGRVTFEVDMEINNTLTSYIQ